MVKKLDHGAVSVTIQELGTRCWLPKRFVEGGRCDKVFRCDYPEKKTCKAVDAEIKHLSKRLEDATEGLQAKIEQLWRERIPNPKP